MTEPPTPPRLPGPAIDNQAAALQRAIMDCTARGWRLQSSGVGTAVMTNGEPVETTNHILHAVLTLLTCGLWLVVWLFLIVFSSRTPQRSLLITVDQMGNVSYQSGR